MPGMLLTQRSKKTTHRFSFRTFPVEIDSTNAQLRNQDFAWISANYMLEEAVASLLTISRLHPFGALRDALLQVEDNYAAISYRDLRFPAAQGETDTFSAVRILSVIFKKR